MAKILFVIGIILFGFVSPAFADLSKAVQASIDKTYGLKEDKLSKKLGKKDKKKAKKAAKKAKKKAKKAAKKEKKQLKAQSAPEAAPKPVAEPETAATPEATSDASKTTEGAEVNQEQQTPSKPSFRDVVNKARKAGLTKASQEAPADDNANGPSQDTGEQDQTVATQDTPKKKLSFRNVVTQAQQANAQAASGDEAKKKRLKNKRPSPGYISIAEKTPRIKEVFIDLKTIKDSLEYFSKPKNDKQDKDLNLEQNMVHAMYDLQKFFGNRDQGDTEFYGTFLNIRDNLTEREINSILARSGMFREIQDPDSGRKYQRIEKLPGYVDHDYGKNPKWRAHAAAIFAFQLEVVEYMRRLRNALANRGLRTFFTESDSEISLRPLSNALQHAVEYVDELKSKLLTVEDEPRF